MFWNWFGLGASRRRVLFDYHDGVRCRRADPVAVEAVFMKHLGHDWPEAVRELSKPYPTGLMGEALDAARADRMKRHDEVIAAVCAAFGVQEFRIDGAVDPATGKSGAGLGRFELFDLLNDYQLYAADLLEASRPFANAQPRASPTPEPQPPPSPSESISAAPPSPVPAHATLATP